MPRICMARSQLRACSYAVASCQYNGRPQQDTGPVVRNMDVFHLGYCGANYHYYGLITYNYNWCTTATLLKRTLLYGFNT